MIGLNKQEPELAIKNLCDLIKSKTKTQWREPVVTTRRVRSGMQVSLNKETFEVTTRRVRSGLDHPTLSVGTKVNINTDTAVIVTGIRYQRLQNISEVEARAEGVECVGFEPMIGFGGTELYKDYLHDGWGCWTAKESFESLVTLIHGDKFWSKNDWVWVIEFELLSNNKELSV